MEVKDFELMVEEYGKMEMREYKGFIAYLNELSTNGVIYSRESRVDAYTEFGDIQMNLSGSRRLIVALLKSQADSYTFDKIYSSLKECSMIHWHMRRDEMLSRFPKDCRK